MTIIDVGGQWQEPGGAIQHEDAKLLRGLPGARTGDSLRRIEETSDEFTTRFNQAPVFRIVIEICAGLRWPFEHCCGLGLHRYGRALPLTGWSHRSSRGSRKRRRY